MAMGPSYREWYLCDNFLSDRHADLERDGHPLTGLSWLAVLNPVETAATVRLSAYLAEAPPATCTLAAPPQRATWWELHRLDLPLPRNEPFGLRLLSDRPIIPQATQFEFRAFERFPEAAASKTFHPGPIDGQCAWYFADGWMGGGQGQSSWYERERLYVLNPGPDEARVDLTIYSERDAASAQYWVAAERLHTLNLIHLPGYRWRRNQQGTPASTFFSARLRSTVPVVVQKTRRAYVRFDPTVQGMWTTIGCPAQLDED